MEKSIRKRVTLFDREKVAIYSSFHLEAPNFAHTLKEIRYYPNEHEYQYSEMRIGQFPIMISIKLLKTEKGIVTILTKITSCVAIR